MIKRVSNAARCHAEEVACTASQLGPRTQATLLWPGRRMLTWQRGGADPLRVAASFLLPCRFKGLCAFGAEPAACASTLSADRACPAHSAPVPLQTLLLLLPHTRSAPALCRKAYASDRYQRPRHLCPAMSWQGSAARTHLGHVGHATGEAAHAASAQLQRAESIWLSSWLSAGLGITAHACREGIADATEHAVSQARAHTHTRACTRTRDQAAPPPHHTTSAPSTTCRRIYTPAPSSSSGLSSCQGPSAAGCRAAAPGSLRDTSSQVHRVSV